MGKKRKFESDVFGDVEAWFQGGTWEIFTNNGDYLGYAEKDEEGEWKACFVDGDAYYTGWDFGGFHNGELGEQDVVFECNSLKDAIEEVIYICETRRSIVQFIKEVGNCKPLYAWASVGIVLCYSNAGDRFSIEFTSRVEGMDYYTLTKEYNRERYTATVADPKDAREFIFEHKV